MALGSNDYAGATSLLEGLLEELHLAAYLFEIEPLSRGWRLRVDCAVDGEWQSTHMDLDHSALADCEVDPAARDRLLAALADRLEACRRNGDG